MLSVVPNPPPGIFSQIHSGRALTRALSFRGLRKSRALYCSSVMRLVQCLLLYFTSAHQWVMLCQRFTVSTRTFSANQQSPQTPAFQYRKKTHLPAELLPTLGLFLFFCEQFEFQFCPPVSFIFSLVFAKHQLNKHTLFCHPINNTKYWTWPGGVSLPLCKQLCIHPTTC